MFYKVSRLMLLTAVSLMAAVIPGFTGRAFGAGGGTALLIKVMPEDGGSLNINPGVHMYDRDAEVTLTAAPKPGYQFVCWQGAVKEAASTSTLVFLDSPKIVVAVFERSKFDLMDLAEEEIQLTSGGGRLISSRGDISAPLEQAGGGRRPHQWHWPKPPKDEDDDVPIPDDEGQGDVPIPDTDIPEPATALYILFSVFYLRKQVKSRFGQIENKK